MNGLPYLTSNSSLTYATLMSTLSGLFLLTSPFHTESQPQISLDSVFLLRFRTIPLMYLKT
jgi:hypothetical protein